MSIMICGVSSACLYPQYTERAIKDLLESGIKLFEIFVNSPSEVEPGYLKKLKKLLDSYGARVVSMHPYTSGMEGLLFFTGYRRRFRDGIDLYRKYFEGVQILGGDIVVFHGGYKMQNIPMEKYAENYSIVDEIATVIGARLCHENVERCLGRSPEFFTQLLEYIPHAKFVLDIKQVIRAGYTIDQMVQAMQGHIAHVHISDHAPQQDCLPLGQGVFDIAAFAKKLYKQGYNGAFILELYRSNYEEISELVKSDKIMQCILTDAIKFSTIFDKQSSSKW